MNASALISIIALILSLLTVVLVTVLSFRNADKAYLTLNRVHKRQSEQLDSVLDRLMTVRWEDLVALRSMDEGAEGGFIAPGDEDEEEEIVADRRGWGALRDLKFPGTNQERTDDEQALLDEDFPDEMRD